MQNILIVDDDKEIVKAIEIYLERKKYQIFKAISFLCIPICIIVVILSIFAVYVKNGTDFNESKYYASGSFVTSYIDDLSKWTCELYKWFHKKNEHGMFKHIYKNILLDLLHFW